MTRFVFNRLFLAGFAAFVSLLPLDALAQANGDLRADRDAALQRMIADPTDRDAMLAHASASIRLREFEPAVSTLERVLDQYPGEVGARLDLAIAYFALGAYPVADHHFAILQDVSGLPSETQRTIAQYRQAIAERTAPSGFSGNVAVGVAYSTNATLRSDSPTVFSLGVPLTRAPGVGSDGDVGGLVSARVEHRYDMNSPNGDTWFTELGFEALHFVDKRDGDFDGIFLRTGPSLSLDQFAFGPKLRPFVELDTIFTGGDWLYSTAGVGVQFSDTLTSDWSIYGSFRSGYRWHELTDADGPVQRAVAGVIYRPTRDFKIRLSGLAALDNSQSDAVANLELGGRIGADYDFDAGLAFAERKWRVSAYGQILDRSFLDPDAAVDPTRERDDLDIRVGSSLTAHFVEGFYVKAALDWLSRQSNIPQFEGDELLISLSVGLDF
ncbi:MAG: hypothetical protein AAF557_12750 [Pseudomonadota bacterium]